MPRQRTLDDIAGELADLEAAQPELFADPHQLGQHLGLDQHNVPELGELLDSIRKIVSEIARPFRRG
jgi:hypothetical protein